MRLSVLRPPALMVMAWFPCAGLFSQTAFRPLAATSKVEPGLEVAVDWKWWVEPSEGKAWGVPLPDALMPKALAEALHPVQRPTTYEVRKGDALIKIAKKFDMTTTQLKQFNELKEDRILIGQVLRIPTPGELLSLVPPPPEPAAEARTGARRTRKTREPVVFEVLESDRARARDGGEFEELDYVRMQVFLDREMFSPGMIDGKAGPMFRKVCELYQKTRRDAASPGMLKAQAEAALEDPYTRYILRADDFKFITLPKDEPEVTQMAGAPARRKGSKVAKTAKTAPVSAPVTVDQLVAEDFLGYTSAWEFVAERFHCDEEFLHHINPQLKGTPVVGTEFQVPDVIPFEIEHALDPPLQPVADPQKPVTAAVVVVSWLEISRDGKLIAVMPLASARPGLHGRDKWTVLGAIPQPRLVTKHEPREPPKAKPATAGNGGLNAEPVARPLPEKQQRLACGPNNPVGILWIDLAKGGGTDPLPYGLHGTSMPGKMRAQQGIGGFRMSNWDIARAVRLIPAGTALQWKAR